MADAEQLTKTPATTSLDQEPIAPPLQEIGAAWTPPLILLVAMAVFMIKGFALACDFTFSQFQTYDDEGFFLLHVKTLMSGRALYDEIPTVNGPFFYLFHEVFWSLCGSIGHDLNRFKTIALWHGSAGLCALFVYRLTRSPIITALVFLQTFFNLTCLAYEPGHPQELCVFLVPLALVVGAFCHADRRDRAAAFALGFLLGGALLTKVNIGVFLGVSFTLGALACLPRRRIYTIMLAIASALALLMPALLLRNHITTRSGGYYAVLVTIAAIPFLVAVFQHRLRGALRPRSVLWAALGFAACLVVSVGYALLNGTSLSALIDFVFVQPLHFSSVKYLATQPPKRTITYIAISAALTVVALALMLRRPRSLELRDLLFAGFKIFAGVLIIYAANRSAFRLLFRATPFIWLLLIPTNSARGRDSPAAILARVLLGAVTLYQTLVAYPVCGSQIQWSTFLLIVVAGVLLHDGFRRYLDAWNDRDRKPRLERLPLAVTILGLALLYPLYFHRGRAFLGKTKRDLTRLDYDYKRLYPLALPRAGRIRLEADQVARYHWMVNNLEAHASAFIHIPSSNSLYLWTDKRHPSTTGLAHWTFLDDQRQTQIARDIDGREDFAVIIDRELASYWDGDRSQRSLPLVDAIRASHQERFARDGLVFLTPKARGGEVPEALQFQERAFRDRQDALPLPVGALGGSASGTLSLWIRGDRPGFILGPRPPQALDQVAEGPALLRLEASRQLACPALGLAPGGPRIDNEAWHHVLLRWSPEGARLSINGLLVTEGGQAPVIPERLQIGGSPRPELDPFQGAIKRAFFFPSCLDEDRARALFERGPGRP